MKKHYNLIYVDLDNRGRGFGKCIKSDSFYWYKDIIATNDRSLK